MCALVCVCNLLASGTTGPLRFHACDCGKFSDYRPKDAVRAIKKRIAGNKNFKEVMLALTVSVSVYVICLVKVVTAFYCSC